MNCERAIRVVQGTTLALPFHFGAEPLVYKTIVERTDDTPLTFTVTAHGLVDGWPVAISGIGYDDLDIDDTTGPPDADDFFTATVVDANTLEFNGIDLARLDGNYEDGGSVVYYTPVDMAGASASLKVYSGATLVLTIAAVIDNVGKSITATISAAQTAALSAIDYAYELFYTDAAGAVTQLRYGLLEVVAPGSE